MEDGCGDITFVLLEFRCKDLSKIQTHDLRIMLTAPYTLSYLLPLSTTVFCHILASGPRPRIRRTRGGEFAKIQRPQGRGGELAGDPLASLCLWELWGEPHIIDLSLH